MDFSSNMIVHTGNEELFTAMEMAVISLQLGQALNIHAYGLRGTGKTSVFRSIKTRLPYIKRIKGCEFNCDPLNPICPKHRNLNHEQIKSIGTETIPMPMLEISHSAKMGTVVGSIDLKLLTAAKDPSIALLPGTIAKANRGVIFIDEINRLADTSPELTDVLLDVMGTKPGTLQIEEEGLPKVVLPISVSIWAASNPDEDPGPLKSIRKQLSDRFDLNIQVEKPSSVEDLMSIITSKQHCSASQEPKKYSAFLENYSSIIFDSTLLKKMASIFLRYELESLRSLKSWYWASKILCVYRTVQRVENKDLIDSFCMCFRHRLEPDLVEKIVFDLQGKLSSVPEITDNIVDYKSNPDNSKDESPEKNNSPKKFSSWLGNLFYGQSTNVATTIKNKEIEAELSVYDQAVLDEARQLNSVPAGQRVRKSSERD